MKKTVTFVLVLVLAGNLAFAGGPLPGSGRGALLYKVLNVLMDSESGAVGDRNASESPVTELGRKTIENILAAKEKNGGADEHGVQRSKFNAPDFEVKEPSVQEPEVKWRD